ncbi:hypothetical protein MKK75_24985 [Methylobacterium sp. J-030]|uniref:hypothetical protein n=1 Tax=Methylobacterium sp. J-030 TaxID=2836627 RepID=UPI001FB8AA6F|nr:hypothetical protein [Methylobacterium sp. J-030]MCJ2072017.1 hypothetical protein [Methylobacterium sp. J-030]
MDKTVAGLVGAVTLLAAVDPALAAAAPPVRLQAAMQAESYADLLKPIPDAVALLKESDATVQAEPLAAASEGDATVQQAQYYHHHHHHHRFFRPFYHHHHHHHRYFRRYHHHHHHHHGYFRPYGY